MAKGRSYSMTEGSEWKLILLFTLPIMAGNFLQQLYNAVDGIIVGNYVSEAAFTSVGACHQLIMLFLGLSVGMSAGCSILISQYYGAKQMENLRQAASSSLILMGCIGLFLSVVGGGVSRWLMGSVLQVPSHLLADATAYFSIYCYGLVFQFIYNGVAALLRSIGDSSATLYFLAISAVTNVALDLLFVVVFHWGVVGVGVATLIAQGLCAVASLVYMAWRHPIFRFGRGEFRFYKDKGALALKLGIPATLQQSVVSFGNLAIQRLVNSFGQTVMAAFTAGVRLNQFIMIPIFGFNVGISTFTGQNVGAGKLDRVASARRQTLAMSAASCLITSFASVALAVPLVRLFGLDGPSLELGVRFIRDIAPLFLIFSLQQPSLGLLQGSGDVRFTAATTLLNLVVRVIASYWLVLGTSLTYRGLWLGMPIGWMVALLLCLVRYYSGVWKTKSLVTPLPPTEL